VAQPPLGCAFLVKSVVERCRPRLRTSGARQLLLAADYPRRTVTFEMSFKHLAAATNKIRIYFTIISHFFNKKFCDPLPVDLLAAFFGLKASVKASIARASGAKHR
jgi:hypothetical protein